MNSLSSCASNLSHKKLKQVGQKRMITNDLMLKKLDNEHAKELFLLTDQNRAYLRKWLPWVDACTEESDSLRFIVHAKQAMEDTGNGITFGIFYQRSIAGTLSFNTINWNENQAEIGYWLGEQFQGLGLVTAACRELIDIGFKELGLSEIIISCAEGNEKSKNVPLRLSFKKQSVVPKRENLYGTDVDHIIYAMKVAEWHH